MAPPPPKGASATSDAASDAPSSEELPFRSTRREDEALAHAVARGKSVLWPVTFLSTLGIGVGCSVGGIVKTKGWKDRFYFQVFIATLIGWLVLLVIQFAIMNELYTERRSRNAKVVVALAMAFGVQAVLGVGTSLVGFYFYCKGYVGPVRKSRPHIEEKRQIRPPHRQASDAIKRRLSGSSRTSKPSRWSDSSRTQVGASTRGSSCSSGRNSKAYDSSTSEDSHDGGLSSPTATSFKSADSASGPDSTNTDADSHTSDDSYPPRSDPRQRDSRAPSSWPPLPTPPANAPTPPSGARPPSRGALRVPVRVDSAGRAVSRGRLATTSSIPVKSQIPASLRPGAGRTSYRPSSPTGPSRPASNPVTPTVHGPPRSGNPVSPSPSPSYPGQPIYRPASRSPSSSCPGQPIYRPLPNSPAYASAPLNYPETGRAVSTSTPPRQRNYRAPTPFARRGSVPEVPSVSRGLVYTPQAKAPPPNPDALPPMPLFVRET